MKVTRRKCPPTGVNTSAVVAATVASRALLVPSSVRAIQTPVCSRRRLVGFLLAALLGWTAPGLAADPGADWIEPMKQVHARSTGSRGTLALFGDSITVSLAFWAPLEGEPKGMDPAMSRAHQKVCTLSDGLTASGALFVEKGAGHTLIGFFNAGTLSEWRTPNSIVLRINWTLEYNPAGASFDRFGLVTPWIDGNGQHVYFDDLSYTCQQE